MKHTDESVVDFYLTDQYIAKNPSIHGEDSPWKITKILPLVDLCIENIDKKCINLLDAGGGAGLILNAVSNRIRQKHGREVAKIALDLSPGMLEVQRKNNPDLKKALNEDIRRTSLSNKEIDIALMIDLLEHVPDPTKVLEEGKRISSFVILKVPLEDNLFLRTMNTIRRGKVRQRLIEDSGHINVYSFGKLKRQVQQYMGQILDATFTNVFDYHLHSDHKRRNLRFKGRMRRLAAAGLFRLSPRVCSLVFTDFAMFLVKCY